MKPTKFITWLKTEDTAFRNAYFAETGEHIGISVSENDAGTHYMVGSSRITSAQETNLLVAYPNAAFDDASLKEVDPEDAENMRYVQGPPSWVPKPE